MNSAYRRHDISDEVWMLLEPYLADQNSRHESCNTAPQEPKNAKRLLYDPELYRLRHMSHCREYIFASQTMARHTTHSAKTSASFFVAIQIRFIALRAKIT